MDGLSSTTVATLLNNATQRLAPLDWATLEAEVLLAHVMGQPRSRLAGLTDRTLNADQRAQFDQLLERRLQGEPVAYLTGRREFWSLDLQVTPDVLIPRPETELLVELALERTPENESWRIADLGTGSGAIALAIAKERPACHVIATDISPAALDVARANAERLGICNVEFRLGDWCSALHGERFDMIVSNPPYVASGDPHLDDLSYEPQLALVAGENGLQYLHAIAMQAREHLTPSLIPGPSPEGRREQMPPLPLGRAKRGGRSRWGEGGWLLLEHGYDQGAALLQRLAELGYERIEDFADLAGVPRIAVAKWKISNE